MANPSARSITENEVVKLLTATTSGVICRHPVKGRGLNYVFSYRLTGEAAPEFDDVVRHGFIGFQDNPEQEEIVSTEQIDVYVTCYNNNQSDDETGRLVIWAT